MLQDLIEAQAVNATWDVWMQPRLATKALSELAAQRKGQARGGQPILSFLSSEPILTHYSTTIYIYIYDPTAPGLKMKHDTFPGSLGLSSEIFMGDESLRCLTCRGKFGPLVADLRCEVCNLVFRFQDVILSDRFPPTGSQFVVADLRGVRGVYHKSLEICDSYSRFKPGDKGSPREEKAEEKGVSADNLQTTPKARPPTRGEVVVEDANPPKVKREEDAEEKQPIAEVRVEEKSPERKEKNAHPRVAENRERERERESP